ncbi:MAG: HDIG domain-containing protein [Bacteroidales bacterium]|nr:HDIG domain-containing protein [Bacteroidales bacterium]
MKKFISFLLENYKHFITLLLFIISTFLILLIIPHQTKFQYEYQKGKPWLYEDLVAPFDFPILKDPKLYQEEKDSVLQHVPVYASKNKQVFENSLNSLKKDIYNANIADTIKAILWNESSALLTHIYQQYGIIDATDSILTNKSKFSLFYVQSDSLLDEYFHTNFLLPKEAEKYFIEKISQILPDATKIMKNIHDYFKPNIFIDKKLSEQVKQQLLNDIPITKGLIQKGETIISKGEIITSEKYLILESLRLEIVKTSYNPFLLIGQFLTIALGLLMVFLFLYHFRQEILSHFTKTSFILSLIILFVLIAQKVYDWDSKSIYLIPFALMPIIIRSFYDSRLALFVHTITILIISYFLPNSFEFMFMQYMAGTISVFVLINVRRRVQLFLAALFIFITYSVIYFGISIVQTENIKEIEWSNFTWFAINALMVLSAYPLIYIFEKLFGFLSDVTLMELSDINHPILKLLSEKAPGTFQHSLQVANLSEEIIQKIGGNSLLARVGALFHDIGKIELPHYFIENQHHMPNPHKDLQIDKSVEIISGHVNYGIQLAKKYKLPKPIIEFIESHHGTSIMQYFYKTYKQEHPNEPINEEMFRYKGTPPTTKETAVVMIVDAVEAASRSLKEITEESLQKMIDSIIQQKLNEHQLDLAPLTLKELSIIKDILKKRLKNIYHIRISYPND